MTTGLTPVRVTARLEAGIGCAGPWGIALDGILASELHYRAKADTPPDTSPLLDVDVEDLDLPLARCHLGEDWHWAATCAWPIDGHNQYPDLRYYAARVDHHDLEVLTDTLPARVRAREGRYRARYAPIMTTVCSAVTWTAVGSPDALADLLAPIAAIGKKRAHGAGRVLAWEITPLPDLDSWTAGHLHPDLTLGRPAPAGCTTGRAVVDAGAGVAGIRPPYIHPSRQRHLRLPTSPARS